MTREKMNSLLRDWQAAMGAAEQQMQALSRVTGLVPESRLCRAICNLQRAYTLTLAALIGGDITAEILEAWWTEHNFGARTMRAGLAGEDLRELDTVDDLAAFLSAALAS